eukprot:COSAG04_NODE_3543_length_2722_cov_75.937095_4_plen_175_part_00
MDDDTFWVCPGSHLRPNSEVEEADLAATATLTPRHDGGKPSKTNAGPIGEAVPVSLKAGDGVVYLNCILHVSALFPSFPKNHLVFFCVLILLLFVSRQWGSNYSSQIKRRTLHFGYRAFNSDFWPQIQMPTVRSPLPPVPRSPLLPAALHLDAWLITPGVGDSENSERERPTVP